jgi:hypothetical protein
MNGAEMLCETHIRVSLLYEHIPRRSPTTVGVCHSSFPIRTALATLK